MATTTEAMAPATQVCRYCDTNPHRADCPTLIPTPDWIYPDDQPPSLCRGCGYAGFLFGFDAEDTRVRCVKCGSPEVEEVER